MDTLPLTIYEREKYQNDIANIYQLGILSDERLALEYSEDLRKDIERNLIIRKKQVLFIPVMTAQFISLIILLVLIHYNFYKEVSCIMLFGNIGGALSTIFYNNKLEIDYYVEDKLLYFEAFKLIILPNILALIGFLAIKSGFILGEKFNNPNNQYFSFLVYIVCGYSQTFIPNMLNNFKVNNKISINE